MTQLAKQQVCIVMRNGLEIWIDQDKYDKLKQIITQSNLKFVNFDKRVINLVDVIGIFLPEDMDALTRRKNGQWQCQKASQWHDKGEKCECVSDEEWFRRAQEILATNTSLRMSDKDRTKYDRLSKIFT
jgi:hypothetical protein